MRLRASMLSGLVLIGVMVSGCTASEPSARSAVSPSTHDAPGLGPLGKPGCAPASPRSAGSGEIQGTPDEPGTNLYGLVMLRPGERMDVGVDIKVVWRMTGKGDLAVRLIDPDGARKKLTWGPEPHGGSTYHRPGDEWGTGFSFDSPGCWEIRLATVTSHASVWVDVAR